jgi:hypothetical protein
LAGETKGGGHPAPGPNIWWGLCCSTYRRGFCRFRGITELPAPKTAPSSGFDVVYQLVLDTALQEESASDILQPIIGTVILSFTPLSRQALSNLLLMEIDRLNHLLDALRAVIHVREGDEVYPIHASLRDFLTYRDRCTDPRIFIHPAQHHSIISRACFDRMESILQSLIFVASVEMGRRYFRMT